jgi:hypothetical protein
MLAATILHGLFNALRLAETQDITRRTARETNTNLRKFSAAASSTFDQLTLVFNSNRPFGVSIMIDGGRNGYSAGNSIRKWYKPPSNSVPGDPRNVQCHS